MRVQFYSISLKMKNLAFSRLTLCVFIVVLTSSCLPASTPAPQATSTTITTQLPTAVPTPTSTVTPTPEPSITSGDWAISAETRSFDPSVMYPLVGSINHTNRKYIDLIYNGLKIALAGTVDVTQIEDLGQFKREQADRINQQEELKKQLDLIISKNNPRQLTAVVVDNQITQVIFNNKSVIHRYHVDDEGNLKVFTQDEEPQLLPELRVNGPYIERADTGEKIQFSGGGLFTLERPTPEIPTILDYVRYYVELNRSIGIDLNIISLGFDTREVLNDLGVEGIARYVEEVHAGAQPVRVSTFDDFDATARYLEEQGIYLLLHPGFINGEFRDFPTEEVSDALNLLSSRLNYRRNILFTLWNEVGDYPGGDHKATWSEWKPWIVKLSNAIYQNFTQEYRPIILVGGTQWARDFRGADIPITNYAIEVHEYKVWDYEGGPLYKVDWWTHMVGKVPVLITENGALIPPEDPINEDLEYVRETLEYVSEHPFEVHYLFIRLDAWGGGSVFYPWFTDRITPKGELWRNSEALKRMTDFTR